MSNSDTKVFRVMMVCTGNTCRSPMAEGILKKLARQDKLGYMDVISSGVGTYDGYPVSTNAVKACQNAGIDISYSHSTQLVPDLINESDLIFALALNHYNKMVQYFPNDKHKIFMLKGFPENDGKDEWSVADPIGLDYEEYAKTFNEIKSELERHWPAIKERYNNKIKG